MLKHKKIMLCITIMTLILAGCNYENDEDKTGFFYNVFAKPLDLLLQWLGELFNHNYGLAIITIVIIVRLILLPMMLMQSRAGHMVRKKKPVVDPYMNTLKEQARAAETPEEKKAIQQKIFQKYNEFGMNPFKQMLGCLPVLLQIPILFGLLVSIKYPSNHGVYLNREFLWFDLTQPDIWITLIAGILYFIQPLVNLPNQQNKKFGYALAIIMPTFIIFVAFHSPSFLGLYWTTNATFLIIQMTLTNIIFGKQASREAEKLREHLDHRSPSDTNQS